ncbi:MAG: hypothetical protein WA139_00895 [Candidatus Aenigmatarchaeota archaeon]
MVEIYEIDGGACKKLEWKGTINSEVAQLAGYSIMEIIPSFPDLKYFIKRKIYNRI